jgi:pyroglutamyl-peptidase
MLSGASSAEKPRLLVTGFGPFPGAPENPTETLMRCLARMSAGEFGASALKVAMLPTEYRRSWAMLRRRYSSFAPDVVIHFGLNGRAEAIHLECTGRNVVAAAKLDASGYAPKSARLSRSGPDSLGSTFDAEAILAALQHQGFDAVLSKDAGDYVCNATLYRSLRTAPSTRRVGFVHVPNSTVLAGSRLLSAACTILAIATATNRI